jgi:hypothetical protein
MMSVRLKVYYLKKSLVSVEIMLRKFKNNFKWCVVYVSVLLRAAFFLQLFAFRGWYFGYLKCAKNIVTCISD